MAPENLAPYPGDDGIFRRQTHLTAANSFLQLWVMAVYSDEESTIHRRPPKSYDYSC
ncbi:hypothetical protein OROMI_004041 [Orobanche minor]